MGPITLFSTCLSAIYGALAALVEAVILLTRAAASAWRALSAAAPAGAAAVKAGSQVGALGLTNIEIVYTSILNYPQHLDTSRR